ncbi:MAG: hypothetical protein ACTTKH_05175 [Treponema sp.]
MKTYFYSCKKNINMYLLINEELKEAILINPSMIVEYFIKKLEDAHIKLKALCIMNPEIEEIKKTVATWKKIYDFSIYEPSTVFQHIGNDIEKARFNISSFNIEAFAIKKANKTCCMYKIENSLFTSQSLLNSILTFNVCKPNTVENKVQTILFPLSGPPTTLKNLNPEFTNLTKAPSYISTCDKSTLANVTIVH